MSEKTSFPRLDARFDGRTVGDDWYGVIAALLVFSPEKGLPIEFVLREGGESSDRARDGDVFDAPTVIRLPGIDG